MPNPNLFKVVRLYFKSTKRKTLATGLTEAQAQRKALSFKATKTSTVVYYKQ